jgi:hypothetical protein
MFYSLLDEPVASFAFSIGLNLDYLQANALVCAFSFGSLG